MEISFYFKNLDSTDAIKAYCQEKLNKLKDRFHHIEGVDVRFKLVRQHQVCEITVHADATVYHVTKQDKDLYAAIDQATDTLHIQVDKHHKKADNRAVALNAADVLPSFEPGTPVQEDITIQIYEAPPKPMTDEEAILQLQNEKYRFHLYHHADERKYSLVFARPDGNFSLIAPTKELGQYQEKVVSYSNNELKEISFSLYPVSVKNIAEAVEQIRENSLEYLAFVNEETKRINVLFHGKNGALAIKRPA